MGTEDDTYCFVARREDDADLLRGEPLLGKDH
jgi:hypothetical protein